MPTRLSEQWHMTCHNGPSMKCNARAPCQSMWPTLPNQNSLIEALADTLRFKLYRCWFGRTC
jgi:hypothetical protein